MKKITCIILSLIACLSIKGQSPTFEWAKQIESSWSSFSYDIKLDTLGNIYTVGIFSGTADFDPGPGTYNLTSVGSCDTYISKMDPLGNLIWAIGIGGIGNDYAYKVKTDKSNNVYIGGEFSGTVDFDPGSGVYNLNSQNDNSFILKLNSNGNFIWAKQLYGHNFSIDDQYNLITSSTFRGVLDFDPGPGVYNLNGGTVSISISKIDSAGSLIWANVYATSSNPNLYATLNSITTDIYGNTYSIGKFEGTFDFDPGAAILTLSCSNTKDLFISKFNKSGIFVWAKQFTTNSTFNDIYSVTVDKNCNVYTTGYFTDVADFDPGSGTNYLNSSAGIDDEIFVSKLDSSGNFVLAKSMGGTNLDVGRSIAVDEFENMYTTGSFRGISDFDPGVGVYNLSALWPSDIFISKLNPQGNFLWAIVMGGKYDSDEGHSNEIDKAGNIYTTGYFTDSVDFDPSVNSFYLYAPSGYTSYVHKMSQLQVGIKEFEKTNDISLYPNPTTGILRIVESNSDYKNSLIEIYNCIGEIIYTETIKQENTNIDLTHYANGIYFIKIINNKDTVFSRKLIKQ